MLTVSLHHIRIRAPHGMYPEEAVQGNDFEVDVDLRLPVVVGEDWPLIDYTRVSEIVHFIMNGEAVPLLEMLAQDIFVRLRAEWPILTHIKICIRKMYPPMPGDVRYAQVCYEG
jgi:dihydroneopterin aldolase